MFADLLWRNLKWRYYHKITLFITIIQPLIWLVLYSAVSGDGNRDYVTFILPGIMVLVLFSACSSGMMNYMMKEQGSFYRLLRSPVQRGWLILGQNLEAMLLSLVECSILVIIALMMGARFHLSVSGLILICVYLLAAGFVAVNVAYSISLKLPNEMIYETIMNLLVLPLFFTSTALFPLEEIQGSIRWFVLVNPFTHIINSIRALLLGETLSIQTMGYVLILFIVLGIGSFWLSLRALNKEYAN